MEPRTSVTNQLQVVLQVWWGLTGFYPSTLIYHVFIKTMSWNACTYVLNKQLDVYIEYLLGNSYIVVVWGITTYHIYTPNLNLPMQALG